MKKNRKIFKDYKVILRENLIMLVVLDMHLKY